MAMIRHRQAATDVPALLLLSARTWDDIPYRDELVETEERSAGFTLVLALTREAPKRRGDHGRRVDAAMMADVSARLTAAPKHVFICGRSEEHTSELQSLMRISYAVFCLKKKKNHT